MAPGRSLHSHADIAQLVERHPSKVDVAGSIPVIRSGVSPLDFLVIMNRNQEISFSRSIMAMHHTVNVPDRGSNPLGRAQYSLRASARLYSSVGRAVDF